MTRITTLTAVLNVCMLAGPAAAGPLADGNYYCGLSQFHLGNMEISSSTYRGPAFDGNFEGDYPFEVTEGGTINWGGPLGGITADGNTVVSTVLKDAGGGETGYDITIQNARGNFQTISCWPD